MWLEPVWIAQVLFRWKWMKNNVQRSSKQQGTIWVRCECSARQNRTTVLLEFRVRKNKFRAISSEQYCCSSPLLAIIFNRSHSKCLLIYFLWCDVGANPLRNRIGEHWECWVMDGLHSGTSDLHTLYILNNNELKHDDIAEFPVSTRRGPSALQEREITY